MFYKITLTSSGGLTKPDIAKIRAYFKQCRHVFLVNEFGESLQNSHCEGIVEFETEHTANVTARCHSLYSQMGVEVSDYSIRVRKITHLVGQIIYTKKELSGIGELILLQGWSQTWIDKTVKENVKNIPHKMLTKKGTRLTQNTGGALIHEWCLANNCRVTNKADLEEVVRLMADEGFLFGSIRPKGIFADVCAHFGDGRAAASLFHSDLQWL